ncbi:MAG: glucosyl transferase [Ignavibacteria bacterium]|nr:glucosyl transferase [Ignavibacteria bacterium]
MKTFKIFPVFILLTFIFFPKCNTTEPPPDNRKLTLTFEDASCTEAWLRLESENISLPFEAIIKKDNDVAKVINLNSNDTIIYIDTLLPNKTYTFKAELSSIQNPLPSNEITATTMDTTSHHFTFETFTFGEHSSSVLYDVAIINENNIWAVGEIYMNDSLGQPDPNFYNVIHFDGNNWEPIRLLTNCRIYFPECGPETLGIAPAKTIFAFNENDIWIAAGNVFHFNGTEWNRHAGTGPENGSANKIWGSSSSDIYFAGNNGYISHYNGTNWQKIGSGTDLDIYDIWGDYNEKTGDYEILLVLSKSNFNLVDKKLLKIEGNTIKVLNDSGLAKSVQSIWFLPDKRYYIVGSGIHQKHRLHDPFWNVYPSGVVTSYQSHRVRGSNINDIFVVGSFAEVVHFNGISWYKYQISITSGAFGNIDIKSNLVVTVGYYGNQGVVVMGRK